DPPEGTETSLRTAHRSARLGDQGRDARRTASPQRSGARYHLWRPDRLRTGTGFGGGIRSATHEVPGLDLAFAFDRDRPHRGPDEFVLEQLLRRPRDLDPPRGPVRLHATRGVHRVAPEVVQKPLPPYHAGDDRS